MKILNRVGGAFLLLVLVAAVVLGFQTPTGRKIWDDLWAAGSAALSWLRDQIQLLTRTPIPGHAAAAIAVAAVGVIVVLGLLKKPISVRAFTVLVLLAGVVAYILYNPGAVANTA
jgi:hypothetical protein